MNGRDVDREEKRCDERDQTICRSRCRKDVDAQREGDVNEMLEDDDGKCASTEER